MSKNRIPKTVEHWDDERAIGNGVIVTLHYGWSFEHMNHEGVRGFDTVREALSASAQKRLYPCRCAECLAHINDDEVATNE